MFSRQTVLLFSLPLAYVTLCGWQDVKLHGPTNYCLPTQAERACGYINMYIEKDRAIQVVIDADSLKTSFMGNSSCS